VESDQFLHYRLTSCLGQGPLGETWQAYDPALERGVAVKLLRSYVQGSDDLRSRHIIMQERLRAQPNPPATVFDWVDQNGREGVVREYIEGESLARRFAQGDSSYQAALGLLSHLSRLVKTMHHCDMVHGNLHPWNIILDHTGEPRLTDALLPDITKPWLSEVPSERRVFIAPEVLAGRTPDRRSDIFSLGAIAIYLFIGERILQMPQLRLEQVAEAYSTGADTELTGLLDIPLEARLLLGVMLAEDPKERFSDIDGLIATLHQVRNPERESAVAREKQTNPRTYLMLSILALLLVILWIVVASVKG
jgi:serine/threonine protein kinase